VSVHRRGCRPNAASPFALKEADVMTMLRDFWFPVLLTAASILVGLLGFYAEGNPRGLILTFAASLFYAACLSYIWGDPVRGPFAKLVDPKSSDTFWLTAGPSVSFPVNQLSKGIDFSQAVSSAGQPIELWIKRTWWSGMSYRVAMKGPAGEKVIEFTNETIGRIPPGWDTNADDNAVEVLDRNGLVRLQVIQSDEFDVYLNTVMTNQQQAIVLKDRSLEMKPVKALTAYDFPKPLFRYPSYGNRGRRA